VSPPQTLGEPGLPGTRPEAGVASVSCTFFRRTSDLHASGMAAAASSAHELGKELSEAAFQGDVSRVKQLLDIGAHIDRRNTYGCTPLILGAVKGNHKLVGLCLNRGADPNANDESGWTPLISAAANGFDAVSTLLLSCKANLEARDTSGWTALHCAVANGHLTTARLLVECGANLEAKTDAGRTALCLAAAGGNASMVAMLLGLGADKGIVDFSGWSGMDPPIGAVGDRLSAQKGAGNWERRRVLSIWGSCVGLSSASPVRGGASS